MTRQQFIGLALIALLCIGTGIFCHFTPQRAEVAPCVDTSYTSYTSWTRKTSKTSYTRKTSKTSWTSHTRHTRIPVRPCPFDPNTADSLTLLRQGLRPWQVSNMLRYRRAGGRWRKTEDLRRLYGLDSAQYQDIAPYVRIAPDTTLAARRRADSLRRDTMPRYVSLKRDTTIELNSADTTDLKKLRGIGSWTARSIVRYREQLGGYHSAEQLREVPHIQQQMLDTTMQHLWADPTGVKTIAVNTASVQRLQRHPYIRFEQARAIYELRRRKIRLNGPEDLKGLPELSEEDIKRIAPYLNFE